MNDSLIRRFCESGYRWPIVATATLLLAVVALVPLVDDYFDKRNSRNELSEKLVRAQQTAKALPKLESQTASVLEELAAMELRTVDDDSLARFRSRLVDVVRESDCQIRRVDVGPPTKRPWKEGDQPLEESARASGGETPFSLERRSVVLAVDGSMPAVHELLSKLEEERTLSHPHRVQLQPVSGGETVTMELELWLFALSRTAG